MWINIANSEHKFYFSLLGSLLMAKMCCMAPGLSLCLFSNCLKTLEILLIMITNLIVVHNQLVHHYFTGHLPLKNCLSLIFHFKESSKWCIKFQRFAHCFRKVLTTCMTVFYRAICNRFFFQKENICFLLFFFYIKN